MDLIQNLPYTDLQEIGIGGFSNVYTGKDGDITVLIKVFKPKKNVEWLLQREFGFSSNLNHPNIRKALTFNMQHLYIVFEYCPGIDLFDFLDLIEDNESHKILPLFVQILDAVEYLHQNGVAHMDLKLENFILHTNTNKLTLIDFGQAMLMNNDDFKIIGLHGTEQYLPPEFYRKYPVTLFNKVDVWCCGMILYNLVYNRMPWKKAHTDDDMYKLAEEWIRHGKLCPHTFPSMAENGISADDENILREIFLGVFTSCPLRRMGLKELRDKTNSLCAIKFENNFLHNIKRNGRREFSSEHIYKQRWPTK